jgi:hypothetical protein
MESSNLILSDKKRFPLTTQEGLSESDQALIDGLNLDQLREAVELGRPLSEEGKQRLKELEEKEAIRAQPVIR